MQLTSYNAVVVFEDQEFSISSKTGFSYSWKASDCLPSHSYQKQSGENGYLGKIK